MSTTVMRRSLGRALVVAAALLALAGSSAPAFAGSAAAPEVVVLPIDRAEFLAGQRFDLRVEVLNAPSPVQNLSVLINGQPLSSFFPGKKVEEVRSGLPAPLSALVTVRDVTLAPEGTYTVSAVVAGSGWLAQKAVSWQVVRPTPEGPRAKNVILFIGDGFGLPVRTAARILSKGLTEGKYRGWLEMDQLEYHGFITTSGMDALATDSANSASAYATGHKSAVNAMGVYPDHTPDPSDDPRVENIAELAKRVRGMSVGLVTTADITDATPAAFVAHTRRRSEALTILDQMLALEPDVIMGGGSSRFLPKSTPGSRRNDNRDVIAEFQQRGYTFVDSATALARVGTPKKLLGLFHLDNMDVYLDRGLLKNPQVLGNFTDQPNLMQMTAKAIEILSQNPNGFFLMVEAASIDKQLHPLDWERGVYDAIELDQAVGVARRFAAEHGDTLIIVTADHSHSMSITGTYHELDGKKGRDAVRVYQDAIYPTFEDKDKDDFPDDPCPSVTLAIGFANHPDYRDDFKCNPVPSSPTVRQGDRWVPNPQRDPDGVLLTGNLPYNEPQEVHTVEDVPVSASGPGAKYFGRVLDNTEVFFGMVQALGLDPLLAPKR